MSSETKISFSVHTNGKQVPFLYAILLQAKA